MLSSLVLKWTADKVGLHVSKTITIPIGYFKIRYKYFFNTGENKAKSLCKYVAKNFLEGSTAHLKKIL